MKTLLIIDTVALIVSTGLVVYFFIKWFRAERKLSAIRAWISNRGKKVTSQASEEFDKKTGE